MVAVITNCLLPINPKDDLKRSAGSKAKQFVTEATELAKAIRETWKLYEFRTELDTSIENANCRVKSGDLERYEVIDSQTGAPLASSSAPIADEDGNVGRVLMVQFPGFVRKGMDASEDLILIKPTIVVKFDQPVPRKRKRNQDQR
jgi:hypothetical protein